MSRFGLAFGLGIALATPVHAAWKPKQKIDRQRFIPDVTKDQILNEHFKEGENVKRACLECHDLPSKIHKPSVAMDSPLPDHLLFSTTDHRRFAILKGPFRSGPEVTAACLTCHTEAARQLRETEHWPEDREYDSHVSFPAYAWTSKHFDHREDLNVDCLGCHDTTGTYQKKKSDYSSPEWVAMAQHIGPPHRANCLSCHLGEVFLKPQRSQDVHMEIEGANFACTDCHSTHQHQITEHAPPQNKRRNFHGQQTRRDERNFLACEACHSNRPHHENVLNDHITTVSCQACHARLLPSHQIMLQWREFKHPKNHTPRIWPYIVSKDSKRHRLTHGILPSEKALSCESCHHPQGLLKHLSGFYLLGRDSGNALDVLGLGFILLSLAGIMIHAGIRMANRGGQ